LDFMVLPGATNVCALDPATGARTPLTPGNPYVCLDASKQPFPANATTNGAIALNGDHVQGGLGAGHGRLLASLDYAVTPNLLIGARAGFAGPIVPSPYRASPLGALHVEGRVTYLFGDDAVSRTFAPLVLAAAGLGEFDAEVAVPVFLGGGNAAVSAVPAGGPVNSAMQSPSTPPTPPTPAVEQAWATAGPVFVAAGAGVRVLLFDSLAATAALKLETAFGGSAGVLFGAAPELGIQLGF
jgi:hypothetical protein